MRLCHSPSRRSHWCNRLQAFTSLASSPCCVIAAPWLQATRQWLSPAGPLFFLGGTRNPTARPPHLPSTLAAIFILGVIAKVQIANPQIEGVTEPQSKRRKV